MDDDDDNEEFVLRNLFAQYGDDFEDLSFLFANLSLFETSSNNKRKMSGIKPPKPLVVNSDIDMCQEWTEWLELFEDYATANKLSAEEATIQTATFRACAGREAIKVLNNLNLSEAEKRNLATLKAKLTDHFAPSKNKTYERCQFHRIKQQANENFEDFLQKVQTQVKKCSYGANADEFVMDQIVVGVFSDTTRQKLWTEDDLNLEKAKKICRAAERATKQISELQSSSVDQTVSALKESKMFKCKRCGTTHGPRQCPAFGKACSNCKRLGHFASKCNAKKTGQSAEHNDKKSTDKSTKKNKNEKKVNAIDDDSSDSEDEEYQISVISDSAKVNAISEGEKWSASLKVGENSLKVKLDTGAECNVLSKREANRLALGIEKSSTKRIVTYNNTSIPVIGEAKVECESKNEKKVVTFKIVEEDLTPILGRTMCEKLQLIVRVNEINSKANEQLGCYKNFEYEIDFIDDPKFKIIPPRRIAHALRDKAKAELDKMVRMKVIRPVSHPTPAVSPMVIVKKGEKIRICMDPTDLNKNIKRRHFPLKTVEEIASRVKGAKYFTKLDCQKGFWQIPVTENASNFLTFSTPWGRYQYLRLPFGISSAPEVFSEIMNATLEGIKNCEIAMDDIFLYAETMEHLESITKEVIDRLRTAGFTLNKEKCEYGKQRVKFLGHIFTAKGMEADNTKIQAIRELRTPTNVKELQRLLGMVNYLGKFIPNLSELTEPLRILLLKETAWHWDHDQQVAFENVKKVLSSTPVLRYYNVNESVKLSVDASSKAIGACLMQRDQPVAYATRALTPAQQNFPQIEKEAMAIKFACTKFHEYVYGKRIEVETDHKPLETIFKKPLQNAPLRLQRILWDVIQYSPNVTYKKGTQIPIADALSRDCNPIDAQDEEKYSVNVVLSFTDEARDRFVKSTAEDLELRLLKEVVQRGWPNDDGKLPEALKKYANFKEEITFEQGLLFKGPKVIVPKIELNKIVRDLHSGHVGIASSLARARQSLYWYGQSKDIREYVEKCSVCQQTQRSNIREPQLQKTVPEYPFQLVSTDLFHFKGDEYILIADHYSGFMDFKKLKSANSSEVIDHMRQWFSIHGIPEIVESDGGPQYMSKKFSDFSAKWQFKHQVSSPYYPRSNGFAERNVQTAKNLLKRCWLDGTDICLGLLMLRNTPRNDTLKSPSQRLFSRSTRTILPSTKDELKPKIVVGVSEELKQLRLQQGIYADRVAKPTEALKTGDQVRLQTGHREWVGAKVVEKTQYPRSVIVETDDGAQYRRNTIHLHKTKANLGSNGAVRNGTSATPIEVPTELNRHDTSAPPIEVSNEELGRNGISAKPIKMPTEGSDQHITRSRTQTPTIPRPFMTRSGRTVKPVIRYDASDQRK